MLVYATLIAFFVFFYAAAAFDPGAMAATTPGSPAPSAALLDTVLVRITALGALYLVVLCLAPEAMVGLSVPFYIGGPSLLIAALVAMDVLAKWQHAWRRGTSRG
jgi:preprotein translocase subunit SecY